MPLLNAPLTVSSTFAQELVMAAARQNRLALQIPLASKTFVFEHLFSLNSRLNPNTFCNMSGNGHGLIA
jgi:hypothetical protein